MSFTFRSLLDKGWTVAGYGAIKEEAHPLSKIRNHIQIKHRKGKIVKCFIDPETDNFMVANRNKTLEDYFK